MDAELAARLRANDRKVYIGLGIAVLIGLAIFAAFLAWRVSTERKAWFARDALLAAEGTEISGTVMDVYVRGKSFRYSWEWAGKHYEGNLGYCKPVQGEPTKGAVVPLRIAPSRPQVVRCDNPGSWQAGPPSYWDAAGMLAFALMWLVGLVFPGFEKKPEKLTLPQS